MTLLEKVKEVTNEKFFKEVTCSCCGSKGRIASFKKLRDGSLLCKKCANELPYEFDFYWPETTLAEYNKAMEYKKYSKKVFEPIFESDLSYILFQVDTKNRLFRVKPSALIFELDNIERWNMKFEPEEAKGGAFVGKVMGNVELELVTKSPKVQYREIVEYGATSMGKIPFLTRDLIYDLPENMKNFISEFEKVLAEEKER